METLTLTELGARLARRWPVLLVGALLGTLVGIGVHVAVPPRYAATTVLLVDADDPARVDMAAEVAVASSRRVTTEALDALGDPDVSITALEASARATSVEASRLLRVTYSAADAHQATRGADAVAQAYLAVRSLDASLDGDRPAVDASVVDPARVPRSTVGPGLAATLLGTTVLGALVTTPVAARPGRPRRSRAGPAS